jgi:hypothetical protein
MRALKETTRRVIKDKEHTRIYEWINGVPLNDNKKTLMVNYLEYWIEKGGEITQHNSGVTGIAIDDRNASELAEIGSKKNLWDHLRTAAHIPGHRYLFRTDALSPQVHLRPRRHPSTCTPSVPHSPRDICVPD